MYLESINLIISFKNLPNNSRPLVNLLFYCVKALFSGLWDQESYNFWDMTTRIFFSGLWHQESHIFWAMASRKFYFLGYGIKKDLFSGLRRQENFIFWAMASRKSYFLGYGIKKILLTGINMTVEEI